MACVGQPVRTGGTTSLTDTLKKQVVAFPEASVAVNTTTVSPVVKRVPDGILTF